MTYNRRARIWNLVAEQAANRGGQARIRGRHPPAASGAEPGHLMRVTDEVSELLAELQLTLGEGPCSDAAASGGPVLASDLGEPEAGYRWPVFAPAARLAGAAAIFAFPLQVGAIRTGVMGLYRARTGPLSTFQLGDALLFADTATLLLLDAQDQTASGVAESAGSTWSGPGGQTAALTRHRAEIDQATGMLTEQLGVGIAEAFIRLRAYAYAHDRRLSDLARDIVARRLRLHPDPDPRKEEQA